MKPEANIHYFTALFICAAVVWLVGPLFLSFLFDAVLLPASPGKFVPPAQVKATWGETLKSIGVIGWIFTVGYFVLRGQPGFGARRANRGWAK